MGNHQSPGKMPVTTKGSAQEQSVFDLSIKTHEQFTAFITPWMLFPAQGCPHLSAQLSSPVLRCPRQQLQDRHQGESRRTPEPAGLLWRWKPFKLDDKTKQRGQIVDRGWTLTLPALGRENQLLGATRM